MTLLAGNDLSISYGARDVFSNISVSIPPDARVAIVGPNGVGKTTLLRILLGLEEPTHGQVFRANGIEIGYLPQEAGLTGKHSLWEECLQAMSGLRAMEAQLRNLEVDMADAEKAQNALAQYGPLQEAFDRRGGYTYETRIRTTLSGLGFEADDYKRPLTQLSGGQRTRAFLARLLLSDPDLLVLDEPTNHLDIAAVEWLEGYFSHWQGATLIVSHDRYFLDRVVNHIWEMRLSGIETYRGNYTSYLTKRQERWERQQKVFLAEKERLEKELDYVKRNIAGQRTSQAKGKLRRLSREVEAIQSLGLDAVQGKSWIEVSAQADISTHTMNLAEVERSIRSLKVPNNRPPQLNINLKSGSRSGDLVLRTYNLEVGYADEDRPLFHCPDLVLKRGECAAIIGPNGAGKTTFLKTMLGQVPPYSGELILGASLEIGYFAQAHEELQQQRTLMEEINAIAPNMLPADVRNYLARFLFSGDDVFKRVSTLSGGERGRLALAKLALTNANLLLLDEPTNHLDIPSQEILQEVLAQYYGTILLVSHDRYLIDALGTQIWDIQPDKASMNVFPGGYSAYHAELEAHKSAQVMQTQESGKNLVSTKIKSGTSEWQRQERLREIESRISALEAQLESLARQLENPPSNPLEVQKLGTNYVRLEEDLHELLSQWEALHT